MYTIENILPGEHKNEINWPKMFILFTVAQKFYMVSPVYMKGYF